MRSNICIDTLEDMCASISKIGPYVSGLSICSPVSANKFRYYLSVTTRRGAYRQFHIPKKSGGVRVITAPDGELKDILRTLAFILAQLYTPTHEAMAFVGGRSIVDNARQHLCQNYVLNLDLKDFFSSITAAMLEREFVNMGIPPLLARDLSSICTYPMVEDGKVRNVLPQGSPASPILSNICSKTLDFRLSGLARRFHLTYTRYADDMTFSSNHNVYQPDGVFFNELYRIIEECHFKVNPSKTRLQKRGSRQEVTGLTVVEKPNVGRKFLKGLRAMIHKISYIERPSMHDINVARGKLNFLRMIKGDNDSTYRKLLFKLNMATRGKNFTENV